MLSQRAALAVLIAVEAAAFAYLSETVLFPAVVAAAAAAGAAGRWRYVVTPDRQVLLALVAALLFVLKWRIDPHSLLNVDIMFYLSPFLHSVGQYLLVLQTAALFLHHDRDLLPVTLPWPGVFVMISAGDRTVDETQRAAFQFFAIAFMAMTAIYFAATARKQAGRAAGVYRPGKAFAAGAVLAVTAAGGWAAAAGLHRYERALDQIVTELLSPSYGSSEAGFPSRSKLGSVVERKTERSHDVALRVYAAAEPGYLSGKAYHWLGMEPSRGYSSPTTQWAESPPEGSASAAATERDGASELRPTGRTDDGRHRYTLIDPVPPGAALFGRDLEVWLEEPLWGVYFLPQQPAYLDTPEELLHRDFRGLTSASDVPAVTYTARTGPSLDRDPFFDVSPSSEGPFGRPALSSVPPELLEDDEIRRLADQVFAGCRTTADHVRAVERHFQLGYGYAIGITVPNGKDPLRWFLLDESRPSAHCEYFAQGAALLLRLRGIPTRYVTGFVAAERNEIGGYWLARNEHAHAWCEAWDDGTGWTLVEATPAAGVPAPGSAPDHRQAWDYLTSQVARFRYGFAEGGWPWLAAQVGRFLMTPAGWLVSLAVAGYVAFRMRGARKPLGPPVPPAVVELNRLLRRMDRRTAKAGITRPPGETLIRFADRVASELGDAETAAWYRDYAATRYGVRHDAEAIASLADRVRRSRPLPRRKPVLAAARAS